MLRKHVFNATPTLCLCLLSLFLFSGCANIVPPSGGEKDVTPPQLMEEIPKDSVLNKYVYQVTLHFSKFMEVHNLEKYLSTSPLLPSPPTVTAFGKTVRIKLPDSSLKPNTTYNILLGNALTDNREQTPYANFVYTFSTGSYFDSLKLKGNVVDAASGLPDTAATVVLYPAGSSDSAVIKKRPEYVTKVKPDGSFEFKNLPKESFKIFAISDEDHNYLYTPGSESIDFADQIFTPVAHPANSIHFAIFKEIEKDTTSKPSPVAPGNNQKNQFAVKKTPQKPNSGKQVYEVSVDTFNKKSGTYDIGQPLEIKLFRPLKTIDSSHIYLSYDDKDIDVEAIRTLSADSEHILVHTQWIPDKVYTLRLIKGWAVDTAGQELIPGKYIFHTKSLQDYATLNINMDSSFVGKQFLLILSKDGKDIWTKPATKAKLSIPLLNPGDYTLKLVIDKNENGHWDTGNFFKKEHAEKVIPYIGKILLKPGWVNDIDFTPNENNQDKKRNNFLKTNTASPNNK